MVSIIICSTKSTLDESLTENIRSTIGVDYEIILIDNSQNQYSMFSAYNEGARRAKGQYLCFMHQDVLFHSTDWGRRIEFYLSNPNLGVLGLAGGPLVPKKGDWRFKISSMHMLQGYNSLTSPSVYEIMDVDSFSNAPLSQVAIIDGVWFCIRKELFSKGLIKFDEEHYNSFHLYDSDICMQVNHIGLDIAVCSGIRLEHMSDGTFSQAFADSCKVFQQKWEDELPLLRGLYMSEEEINSFTETVEGQLLQRIKEDETAINIRKYFAQKEKGEQPAKLSEECIQRIEEEQYKVSLKTIRSKVSEKEAITALRRYKAIDRPIRYQKLLFKFIVYRYILRYKLK